ncbi:MAG: glycosyltransferase family 2 protein [bacterium]|nr:glycosyltransferase family 2 protein [bacterium]
MKLIIQIPCYNEAETLEIALNELPRRIDGVDEIEYLIINDGSSDDTEKVALDWGVHYIVHFKRNLGLAKGFLAGIDLALRHGADIIVNTDADNQYCGADIEKLIQPILKREADIVIGERPIDENAEFSYIKKKLQRFGSFVVRLASKTDIPDAPSGFRAYSRKAAMRVNVHNEYTYTLETIVQAGRNKMAITSVPVKTNPELRESRLMHSIFDYVKKSVLTILRAVLMYRPLRVFTLLGMIAMAGGVAIGVRFMIFYFQGNGGGHTQSLILAAMLIIIGSQTFVTGMQADIISANRKLLEDIQFRIKKLEFALLDPDGRPVTEKENAPQRTESEEYE